MEAAGIRERCRAQVVEQAAGQPLGRLLLPPLLEVGEHVPRRGALQPAVHVVPRLPRPAAPQGRVLEVVLHEVVSVRRVQALEQRVLLVVVPDPNNSSSRELLKSLKFEKTNLTCL